MSKQRTHLGRGLGAIIPGGSNPGVYGIQAAPGSGPLARSAAAGDVGPVAEIPIDAISPNHQQPRSPIEETDELHELAESIRQHGVLQPLIVTFDGDDGARPLYQIIAGERRWRAAQIAGLLTVPVVIREASPRQMIELALVENLQRSDLNPLEAAHGYLMLMEEYGLTQDQVADRVGRNRSTVANTIRLLQLPAEVREALNTMPDSFTEGHARAVLMVNGDAERIALKNQIIAQKLSVRQAEELARRYNAASIRLTADRRGGNARPQSMETKALEQEFIRAVEMKARLQRSTKGKGSLTLFFTNEQQLQTLYQRLVASGQLADGEFGFGSGDGMLGSGFGMDYNGNGGGRGS